MPAISRARSAFAARPAHRLFFAAIPPLWLADRLAAIWALYGTGQPFRRATLHLSIAPVAAGDTIPPALPTLARNAAAEVGGEAITFRFDRLTAFGGGKGDHALVIETGAADVRLGLLTRRLHHLLSDRGLLLPRPGKVTPHVTLAYGSSFHPPRLLDEPICWTADAFVLIDSAWGRHTQLGRWPLQRSPIAVP